jgi:predicted GNAT family N-acyltransferase
MIRIELMPWERARAQASEIRFRVFVEEQGVPRSIELDELDPVCVHAIAYYDNPATPDDRGAPDSVTADSVTPIGTGRLLPDAHIGRMAVLAQWRRQGVGTMILNKLIEKAKERGDREILLSAQIHALDFYRRHGFQPFGEIYEEADIPHRAMRRAL